VARSDIGVAGYEVEIDIEIHLGAGPEEEEQQYERVRRALVDYEDALAPPLWVTLTRRAPLPVPLEALEGVLSICRDAMVDVLGIAADHPEVAWSYRQLEGPYALVVEVRPEPRPPGG
jgi:hypothetical protein